MIRSLLQHEVLRHLRRMWDRYHGLKGDRLAASLSFYSFLSFFPLVLLAISVLGYVVKSSQKAEAKILDHLHDVLPGSLLKPGGIDLDAIAERRSQIGLIALGGLVLSGMGFIGSLRGSLRVMWGAPELKRNFFLSKLVDIGLLTALGAVIAASIAVTATGTQATNFVIDWLNIQETGGARDTIQIVGIVVPFVVDLAVFGYVLGVLPQVRTAGRSIVKGAALGAVLFEALKFVGAFYVAHTAKGTAVYGTFAVIIGLLVWINLVSRLTLYTAAWTATALPMPVYEPELSERASPDESEPADPSSTEPASEGSPAPARSSRRR